MRTAVCTGLAVILLAAVPAAFANRSSSSNWAGYAAHGANFEQVSATWRQPHAACVSGKRTYSAMWVGLGGYSLLSTDLEQVGTELDCNAAGHSVSTAWYELVPASSHTLGLRIRAGDQIAASVTASGGSVTVAVSDLSQHRSFQRTLHPSALDLTSAEWILEAPSACIAGTNFCRTLPLTNFGRASFSSARATTANGPANTISTGPWVHTRITLVPSGQQFVSNHSGAVPYGTARTSSLSPSGGSFSVTFRRVYVQGSTVRAQQREPSGPVYLRH